MDRKDRESRLEHIGTNVQRAQSTEHRVQSTCITREYGGDVAQPRIQYPSYSRQITSRPAALPRIKACSPYFPSGWNPVDLSGKKNTRLSGSTGRSTGREANHLVAKLGLFVPKEREDWSISGDGIPVMHSLLFFVFWGCIPSINTSLLPLLTTPFLNLYFYTPIHYTDIHHVTITPLLSEGLS